MTDPSLALQPVNFCGGPHDGINLISPAANCVLQCESGRYIFDGKSYFWVPNTAYDKPKQ